MRGWLYIVLCCLVCLGGCSGCDKEDPKPAPVKRGALRILSGWWPQPPLELYDSIRLSPSYKYMGLPYWAFDTVMYRNKQYYREFAVSDRSWHKYEWSFANSEAQYKGSSLSLYYPRELMTPFVDTVYVIARDTITGDTAKAKQYYANRPLEMFPHYGRYRGRLYFQGQVYDTLSTYLNLVSEGSRGEEWVALSGLFQRICYRAPRSYGGHDIRMGVNALITRSYIKGDGLWSGGLAGFSTILDQPECYAGQSSEDPRGATCLVKFWPDSMKFKAIIRKSQYGEPVNRLDSIVYTAKRFAKL